MNSKFSYDTDLLGGSVLVRESRVVSDLLLQNIDDDGWKKAIIEDNLLQKKTTASAKRNAKTVRSRLEQLEPEFWRAVRDGDDELAIQAAFCAVLERNLILAEFMDQVIRDAYVTHQEKLNVYQWVEFVEDCGHRDKGVFDWKESSIKKMGQVIFRMLAEMGYIDSTRSKKLQKVLIRPEIKELLTNTSRNRLLACMDIAS